MQQLSFLPGEMTPGERSLILRALKTLDRHLHEPGVAFTSTRAAREWLILNMAGLEREEFRVLYLNNQNQLIAGETLFTGTINRTEVHPREVIKRALYHNAAAVVLAHNHPSGEVTPSKADRLITERLVQALALVDICYVPMRGHTRFCGLSAWACQKRSVVWLSHLPDVMASVSFIWMPALNACRVYPLSTGNQEQHEIINHGNSTGYSDCVAAGQYRLRIGNYL
ncbi:hypothetical protein BANRA_03194 [Escherichia coli]|nr:hypothetical protein BANRA_03194 [Escherichia coli]